MLTPVADGVFVHQSKLLQNNTVVVQGKSGALVIDPGITGDEMVCLASDLQGLGQQVVAGFATHPHWDHVLWHPDLGEASRYGTARCASFMQDFRSKPDWRAQAADGLPEEIADDVPLDLFGLITAVPDGATEVPWDGPRVRIIEHPAHAQGHAALVIEEHGVLVAGDMLSDVLIPMPEMSTADPLQDYLIGLQRLEEVAAEVTVTVPGHGSVGTGDQVRARIELDRAYVHALLDDRPTDNRPTDDPRIGPDAAPGWEWVVSIHEGHQEQLARRRQGDGQ